MKRLSVLLLAAAFLVLLGLGCACAEEQVSGDYVYRINDSGEIVFLSGPTAENGTMLVIPQKIDGKKVTEFSFEQIPEEVTYILAPFNCYCFDQKGLTHDVLVFACQDYETCHSYENLTYDSEAVLPGEYLLLNVYGYMPEKYVFEYNVQKDYYEYPASIDGKKLHNSLPEDTVIQYVSGPYSYYKVSETEICICEFRDKEARRVDIPETLDGYTVVGIAGLGYHGWVIDVSNAEEIILPRTLRILGEYAISSSKVKSITLPAGLKEIGQGALYLFELRELNIPDGVESLGTNFLDSFRVKKLVIPDSVTRIAGRAFSFLYRLNSLELPSGLTEIPENLCKDATNLASVKIPAGVTAIGKSAFNNCGKLNKITFLGSNVKTIGDSAFVDCKALGKIDLPEGVEEIGYQSFYGCKKLSAIVLPSTVKKIGKVAFGSCKALAKVTLGANVEEISDDAFDGCAKKITFIAPEGCYAWNWATAKGFAVKAPK